MIIRRMTASFGKLENDSLSLAPGLNILHAPNEAGKSTWAAFLIAIFYGIDTAERVRKGSLPAKQKYKPWSGKPMEGTVELSWQGKNITLERRSEGRIPMGAFRAYETDTGEPLPWLTAENCGKTLLGVEQSVFVRSAFIGQGALSVSTDAGLEQRLSSLVTAGDETISYTRTEERLRTWKNHIRHNRTGHLPEVQEQLRQVNETLETIRRYHQDDLTLQANRQTLTEESLRLQRLESALKAAESRRKQEQLHRAREAVKQAEEALRLAEEATAKLPDTQTLEILQQELDELTQLRTAAAQFQMPPQPRPPQSMELFHGKSEAEAAQQAEKDAKTAAELLEKKRSAPWWLLAVVGALVGGASFSPLPLALALMLLAIAAAASYVLLHRRYQAEYDRRHREAEALLASYQVQSPEGILLLAAWYGDELQAYRLAQSQYQTVEEEQQARLERVRAGEEKLLTQTRRFASNIYTLSDVRAALEAAAAAGSAAEESRRALAHANATACAIADAIGDLSPAEAVEEDIPPELTLAQVQEQQRQNARELEHIRTTLATHQGQVQALGDPAALEARKQELTARHRRLERQNSALALAMEALSEANQSLRQRFSPQVSQLAGQLFSRMTGGRYDAVRLLSDLSMDVHEAGQSVSREQLTLSSGTSDQLYLALRLAICRLVLSEESPLVLDDALVFFDDVRMKEALSLLQEEAAQRQILLFTCQKREADWLSAT